MSRVVTEIQRSKRERLRVSWDSYEGHTYLDCRMFYEDGAEFKPSKKGITVRPEQLAELIQALQSAQAVGRELKLLPAT